MIINKISAVYFSATGTTKKIVTKISEEIAKELNIPIEYRDFTTPENRVENMEFTSEDLVVIGLPVYAGRLPNLIAPYLKKIIGDNTPVVPVVLYGNRNYDDALMELVLALKESKFVPISAGAFIGEHSFSKILGEGRPDEEDLKYAEKLKDLTLDTIAKVSKDELNTLELIVKGNNPLRGYYTPRDRHGNPIDIRKVKPKTNDNCTDCGKCASICPMGAIYKEDTSLITGICIKCCACVKGCPNEAKYFDDKGYLYHMHELEDQYASERRVPEIFHMIIN